MGFEDWSVVGMSREVIEEVVDDGLEGVLVRTRSIMDASRQEFRTVPIEKARGNIGDLIGKVATIKIRENEAGARSFELTSVRRRR